MRTYYRGPDAVVNELRFVWHQPEAKIFMIDDLDNIRLLRTRASAPTSTEAAIGFGLIAAGAATWYAFGLFVGLPVLAVAAVLVAVVLRARHKQEWQIRATYHAREVKLYASTDCRTFNQVARSLRRSIERRSARQKYGLAAG